MEEFEGLDFKGALKILATRAGVELTKQNKEAESEKERIYKAHELAAKFFETNLTEEVVSYLKSRGLTDESIKNFRIGYARGEWRDLNNHLGKLGFGESEIERAGLIKKSDKSGAVEGQRYYDRFRGRIMFPINDSSGRVIAFSGRIFKDDGKSAKYLNSPETPIFSKSATLYGLDRAKDSIRKNNFSILVEGQIDLVLAHQTGYRNTVATSGTALSDSEVTRENVVTNLGILRRLTENLVLAFDGDKAGMSACERAGRIALSLGMDVKAADIPDGVDPADLISKEGADAWRGAIKNSKHIIEYLLAKILKTHTDPRKAGRVIKEKILPYIAQIESAIEQGHFLKRVSEAGGIGESALREELKKYKNDLKLGERAGNDNVPSGAVLFRKDYIIRKLLGIIFWQKTLENKSLDVINVTSEVENITGEKFNKLEEKWAKEDLIFEAEVFYSGGANLERDVKELLENLKEETLREELGRMMKELYEGGKPEAGNLLKKIKEINEEIQNIKNNRSKN